MYGYPKWFSEESEQGEGDERSGEDEQPHALPRGIPAFIDREMLREIRRNTDWRDVFHALGLEKDPWKSKEDDFWALSPLGGEQTASFHINEKGWYCHSTAQGGGNIELIQKVMQCRTGIAMNCYKAGRWVLEQGLSPLPSPAASAPSRSLPARRARERGKAREARAPAGAAHRSEEKERDRGDGASGKNAPRENRPIKQTLLPRLIADHPQIAERGIGANTCAYLGCGYLPVDSRSPLAGRIIFQVRGVAKRDDDSLEPVVLSHIGRATTTEQEADGGKWRFYADFCKSLELYNLDRALLDARALAQAREFGHYLVVEGSFDVAKLVAASGAGEEDGILNAVATFGAHLAPGQIARLRMLAERTGVRRFRFLYDRDRAGRTGQREALLALREEADLEAEAFDWEAAFPSATRGNVRIPEAIGDVCDFSAAQLRWLREKGAL